MPDSSPTPPTDDAQTVLCQRCGHLEYRHRTHTGSCNVYTCECRKFVAASPPTDAATPEREGPDRGWIHEQPEGVGNSVACSMASSFSLTERLASLESALSAARAEVEQLRHDNFGLRTELRQARKISFNQVQGTGGLVRWLLFSLFGGKGEISVSRESFDASDAFTIRLDPWKEVDSEGEPKGMIFRMEAIR